MRGDRPSRGQGGQLGQGHEVRKGGEGDSHRGPRGSRVSWVKITYFVERLHLAGVAVGELHVVEVALRPLDVLPRRHQVVPCLRRHAVPDLQVSAGKETVGWDARKGGGDCEGSGSMWNWIGWVD